MADEAIRQFTKQEFNTEAPYKLLFDLRNNRFKYNQVFTTLKENAASVGFKEFGRMLKAYAEEQAGRGVIIDNVTQFEGQDLELKTGEWLADDFGITRRNANNGEDIACVHPIMITEKLINIDTNIVKVRVAYKPGSEWKSEIYNRKTLADARSILELSDNDISVDCNNAKFLIKYLHDLQNFNKDVIPYNNSVGHLGWTEKGEFSPYVEKLIYDGNSDYGNMYKAVRAGGSFDSWLNIAKEVRRTDSAARIMLAAGFASVLIKKLGKLNFIVHFWGGSEAGKSVSQMLATSIWAYPELGDYFQTFDGTQVGMERISGFVNSMPLILDEFQLVDDKKSFERMVYMLCEGVSRTRGKKDGGIQQKQTWKNCILTSGEGPITRSSSGGGAVNRIIEIECKEKLFRDAPAIADELRKNYGHAGKIFVMLLRNEGVQEEVERLYKEFYLALGSAATEKQTSAAAIILTADALATKWMFCDGHALKPDDIVKYLSTKESIDTNLRAYEYFRDIIASNRYKLLEKGNITPSGESWGSVSGGKINILKSIFEKICSEGGYDSKALASWMKQRGYTEAASDRAFKSVSINGMKTWCVSLREDDTEFETAKQSEVPFRNAK